MNKKNIALAVAGTLIAAGAIAAVSDQLTTAATVVYYACKDGAGNVNTIREGSEPTCKRGQTVVSWNNEGPQGLPGTNGQDGVDGQDGQNGQTGLGLRVWLDANGATIGPALTLNHVELNLGGSRIFMTVRPVLDENGKPTSLGQFKEGPVFRVSPNTDCSPPYYFHDGNVLPGYDAHAVDTQGPGPREGETDILLLSESTTMVAVKCYLYGNGTTSQVDTTLPVWSLVSTVNLSEIYSAPFTLE